MVGKDVQGISIGNDRTLCSFELRYERYRRILKLAQAGSYPESVEVVAVNSLREVSLLMVHLKNGLWHAHLHDAVVLTRCVNGNFPCTGSQARSSGQDCRSRHAVATGDKQCIAHGAFMRKVVTMQYSWTDIAFFEQRIWRVGLLNVLIA